MNTINGNFLERTIPSLKGALVTLNMGNSTSEMNLEDFKALMAPEPTPIPEASYKVYTALVTQSGGDNTQYIDIGSLTIGVTYQITNLSPGMDFTNVGAPNNEINTYFVATGTTPASWGSNEGIGNETLRYNLGAPVVTVLQNTIGNIWFTYNSVGNYYINSDNLFTENKTMSTPISGDYSSGVQLLFSNSNTIVISNTDGFTAIADYINTINTATPIEIRVYN
jgi:hypothetical protein